MITKFSKNNSHKSNNEYYKLESIFDPSLPTSVVAYKRDIFRNMASENSREALGIRNAFSYEDIGTL